MRHDSQYPLRQAHYVSHSTDFANRALFYVLAITILVLHFTGFLARHNLEWLLLVLAVAVFPAVIYL